MSVGRVMLSMEAAVVVTFLDKVETETGTSILDGVERSNNHVIDLRGEVFPSGGSRTVRLLMVMLIWGSLSVRAWLGLRIGDCA